MSNQGQTSENPTGPIRGKWSEERQAAIVAVIEAGGTYGSAAAAASMSYFTLRWWMRYGEEEIEEKGEDADNLSIYAKFYLAVKAAEARAVERALAVIMTAAGNGTWQAAAWFLERRHPRDFGRQIQEQVGPNDGPVQHKITVVEIRKTESPE